MVFASTLVLVGLVAVMNMVAVIIRNKLRKKFAEGHF
jgi:ABC-type phosphate transport system permease subunit